MPDEPVTDEMTFHEAQSRLRDLGYYDGPPETHPRRATTGALERFQRTHGLRVTGRADPETARALRDTVCF